MNQRKHELQTNELAQTIEASFEKYKPYIRQWSFMAIAIILAIVAFVFWRYTRTRMAEGQWEIYLNSVHSFENRGLIDVAKEFPDTAAGQFAQIRVADNDLMRGLTNIVENREDFNDRTRRAIDSYEKLAADTKASPFIRRRATYGAAHAYETIGDFEKAKKGYQELIDNASDDPIAVLAKQGVQRLSDPSVVAIYEKFKAWQPPVTAPGADELLPPRPNLDFPSEAPQVPATDAPATDAPVANPPETPAGSDDPKTGGTGEGTAPGSPESDKPPGI